MHFKAKALGAILLGLLLSQVAFGLKVYTTTTNIRSLIEAVGGDAVSVESLTRGAQDPHYVDAKPSFMLKLSRADLLVSVGLGLESGWLPAALSGARNPQIMASGSGSLVLGDHTEVLEVIAGDVSREHGDIHPEGNPHFMLDPNRVIELADVVAAKLGELEPSRAAYFAGNAKRFQSQLKASLLNWRQAVAGSGGPKVITYHKTLHYFLKAFGVTGVAQIESKPGVPPTSRHVLKVIETAKRHKVQLTLVENFYSDKSARLIQKQVPGMRVATIAVAVDGVAGAKDLIGLYEHMVSRLTGGGAS